jgi:methanogenic corrinoid protein MtbC1
VDEKYSALVNAIRDGDVDSGRVEALKLVETGTSPLDIFSECIEPTLADIGDKFSRLEIFLPEMMESADAVKAIQEALQPYLEADEVLKTKKGRILICTVSGDLHDIGKNIVKAMLEVNRFEVKDLGVDVAPAAAIAAAKDFDADIIAFSALMLPSLPYVKDAIDFVKQNEALKDRFKILVGGGPVSQKWAKKAGADGYGDDAMDAVQQALALVGAGK